MGGWFLRTSSIWLSLSPSASWTRLIPALRRVAKLSQTVVYLGVQHVLGPCRPYDCLVGGLLVLVVIQRHPLAFLDLARDSGTAGLVAVAQPSILCRDFTVPWTLDSIIFSKVLMLRNISSGSRQSILFVSQIKT